MVKFLSMSALTKPIAVLLFVIMMMNLGLSSFSQSRLSHAMQHIGMIDRAPAEHHHGQLVQAGSESAAEGEFSMAHHKFLHAADHLQFIPRVALLNAIVLKVLSIKTLPFPALTLPLPAFDLPFRPPRSDVLPA